MSQIATRTITITDQVTNEESCSIAPSETGSYKDTVRHLTLLSTGDHS